MGVLVFAGVASVIPERVIADDYEYSVLYCTANYASVQISKGKLQYNLGAMDVAEFADGELYDVSAPAEDYYFTFKTKNFTHGYSGYMPPSGANITAVIIHTYGLCVWPATRLSYALEGDDAYNTSDTFEDYHYEVGWEVTALEDWTAETFWGSDFWVAAQIEPDMAVPYYIDYVGLSIWYTTEDEYEGGSDEDPFSYDGSEVDYGIIYGDGLIGTLGFIGLIGMIAVPGLAIYIHRVSNEGNIELFVKMLALFMFCLTMFMYSINVS